MQSKTAPRPEGQALNGHHSTQAPQISRAEFEALADAHRLTIEDGDHRRGPNPFTGDGKDGFCFFFPECNGSNRDGSFTKSRREMLEFFGVLINAPSSQPSAPKAKTFDTRSLEERGLTAAARARFGVSEPRGVRELWGEYRQFPTRHTDGTEGRERRKFRDPSRQPTTTKDGKPRRQIKTLWDKATEANGQPIAYNLDSIEEGDAVYLVNSELAVWLFWQEGLTAVSPLGEGRSEQSYRAMLQAAKDAGAASITIALDADPTGESATARATNAARAVGVPATAKVWPVGVGDASDFWEKCRDEGRDFRRAFDELPDQAEAPDAEPIEAEQPAPRPRFVFVGAQHVKAQRPPRALIEGVLFENTGAELCGGQATFKSFTALAMAEAVASGADWHGRETKRTPAAYITGEGSAAIGKRIRALEIHTGRSCEVQFLLEAVQIHRPEEVEALLLAVAQLPEKPGLIVVDTLARCFVGGEENSARDAGLFVAGVDRIRAATGATVLILHHINKSGDTRGSTAFAGAFDTMIEAKRENTIVSLRCTKQKDAPDFEAITLARRVVELDVDGEDGQPLTSLVFETTDAPEPIETPTKGEATRGKVLDVLRELCEQMPEGAPGQRFQAEAEARGIKRPTFIRHRDALRGAGEITFDGNRYQVKKEARF